MEILEIKNKENFIKTAMRLLSSFTEVFSVNTSVNTLVNTKSNGILLSILIQSYMKLYLNEIINSDMEDDLLKQMFSLLFEYEDVILFHTFDYAVNIIGSKNSHKFFEFFREDFKLIDRNLTIRILGICDFHRTLNPLINYVNSQCELGINNGQFVISFGDTAKILNEEEILQFIYLLGTNNNCSNTFMYIFDRLIVLRQTLICFLLIENFIHMNEYHILEMLFNHEYIIISQEENAKFPSIKIGTCQRYEIMYLENFNLTYKTFKLMYDIIGKSIDNLLLPIILNNSIFSEESFMYHIGILCADRGCYEEDIFNIFRGLDFSNSNEIIHYCLTKYIHC